MRRRKFQMRNKRPGFPLLGVFTRSVRVDRRLCLCVYRRSSNEGVPRSIIVFYFNKLAYFWKEGTRSSHRNTSVNSMLYWCILSDLITDLPMEFIGWYDLVTANNERIAQFKSKFGGELVPYYQIESAGLPMVLSKQAYRVGQIRLSLNDYTDK